MWLEVVSVGIDVVHVGLFDHGLPCLSSYAHKHTMPPAAALTESRAWCFCFSTRFNLEASDTALVFEVPLGKIYIYIFLKNKNKN